MKENSTTLPEKWFWARIAAALFVLAAMIVLGIYFGGRQKPIDEAKAKSIVLSHAGVAEADLFSYSFAMDEEQGRTVYQLEFSDGTYDYDYEVSAKGEIVKCEKQMNPEDLHKEPPAPVSQGASEEDPARAKEIALTHAGLSESDLTDYTFAMDVENGVQIYELEFAAGNLLYKYEIDPAAGTVLKAETEQLDPAKPPQGNQSDAPAAPAVPSVPEVPKVPSISPNPPIQSGNSGSTLIGEAKAKSIALTHAGAAEADIFNYTCKLDSDDGVQVYEVGFYAGEYEYDYEINALSGAILKSDKEWEGSSLPAQTSNAAQTSGQSAPTYIGELQAKEIAFSRAGLAAADVTRCAVELDHHDDSHHGGRHHGSNCCVYEVDFHCGGYEYDCKIDALTGTVLEFGQEAED